MRRKFEPKPETIYRQACRYFLNGDVSSKYKMAWHCTELSVSDLARFHLVQIQSLAAICPVGILRSLGKIHCIYPATVGGGRHFIWTKFMYVSLYKKGIRNLTGLATTIK